MTLKTPSARIIMRAAFLSSWPSVTLTFTLNVPMPRSFHSLFVNWKSFALPLKYVFSCSSPVSTVVERNGVSSEAVHRAQYHILCRSKNLSSGFSASNSLGPVSASPSSSSSSSASAAPNGLSLVLLPNGLGAAGEAKLVSPPGLAAVPNPPLNTEKPDPKAAKPEVFAPAANPAAAGFSVSDAAGDLKTDGVDAPSEPKGDCSDPANAARLDEAKAEAEVTAAGLVGPSSSLDFDAPREPNGETVEVFAKALVTGVYRAMYVSVLSQPKIQCDDQLLPAFFP